MKRRAYLILSVFVALSIIAPPDYYALEEIKVSMDFENAALKDVLKAFSRQTGMNFIASDVIEGKQITIFLKDVSIDAALSSILEANGLSYEKQVGDIYLVKPSGKEPLKLITKVYKLNYLQVYKMAGGEGSTTSTAGITIIGSPAIAAAGSTSTSQGLGSGAAAASSQDDQTQNILEIVKSLMSRNGTIVADRRNNSLIATDIPGVFANIEAALKELDVQPIQIMIQAEIIETTTNAIKRVGLEYGTEASVASITYGGASSVAAGQTSSSSATFPTPWPLTENFIKDAYNTNMAASQLFRYGTFTMGATQILLKLFAQDNDTKYLARPRIMTINNEPAVIKISANTAIGTTSSSVTQTGQSIITAERTETGIVLRVTPHVNSKGEIFMNIEPSVSRAKASSFFPAAFQDPSYRTAACTVMVRDKETAVIGGLIQSDNFKNVQKVPFLGDIPVLGEMFKSRYKKVEDTELLIFITPHIVEKRDGEYIIPQELTERDYMIQKTLEKYSNDQLKKREQEKKRDARKTEEAMEKTLGRYSKKTGGQQIPVPKKKD